jgi:hypothetical protein
MNVPIYVQVVKISVKRVALVALGRCCPNAL